MRFGRTAASGIKWTAFAHYGRRALSLLTNIVLARLLAPADFGVVAMAAVVLGFVELFRDLGTGSAVVQRKDVSEALLSSIFWINAGFGLLATLALWLMSPLVALFYHEPQVDGIMRAVSLSFFLASLGIVQVGLLNRELAFERLARIELGVAALAAAVGIGAALSGAGVWSLVYQMLANTLLLTLLYWQASSWRPTLSFSWTEVRSVLRYSLNLTGSNVFGYFARNADALLIGRYLGARDLGFYDLAYRLMLYPLQSVSAIVGRVMFPFYARMQDDLPRYRAAYLRIVGAIALLTFPLMFGLFALSDLFVRVVFGPQWQPVSLLLMIFAPLGALQSINTTVGAIYMALGRTDLMLRWTFVAGMTIVIAVVIGLQWGLFGVAIGYAIASLALFYPSLAIPFRLIELPMAQMARALARPMLCSAVMCAVVYAAKLALPAGIHAALALGGLTAFGVLVYAAATWTVNRAQLREVLAVMRGKQ